MTLITNSTPAERSRGCMFAEDFENANQVARNGATVGGSPVINNGLTTDGVDDEVTYAQDINNTKSISFWVTLATDTENIMQLSASHSIEAGSGTLTATGLTSPTFYVDGVATATITTTRSHVTITTATAFNADAIQIGQDASFGQFKIEDVKMWTTELTAAEVTDLANDSTYEYINETILDLPMGMGQHDITNTQTLDLSATGNDATWTAGATAPTKLTANKGYTFDGTADLMYLTNSGTVDVAYQTIGASDNYTIAVWIKTSGGTGGGASWWANDVIMELREETASDIDTAFSFGIESNTLSLGRSDASTAEREVGSATVNDGIWHLVCAVVTDDVVDFYIDGALDIQRTYTTVTGDSSVGTNSSNFFIGSRSTDTGAAGNWFAGDMMGVKMWGSALTALQIADLYQREFKKINDI